MPFTVYKGELWFLFARHKVSRELGDWAGGIKKHETALSGGFREFREESKEIFTEITLNDCASQIALVDGVNMATIFVPISYMWLDKASQKFKDATSECSSSNEISEAVWISESKFYSLVRLPAYRGDIMWRKIRKFFGKTQLCDLISILKSSVESRCHFIEAEPEIEYYFRWDNRLIAVSS